MTEWEAFQDIAESEHLFPVFGMRLMVGMDSNGKMRIVMDRAGTIEVTQLVGILEVVQSKLFREFAS